MAQPNVTNTQKWEADLCDCSPCSSCMLSCCVPCFLIGKTSERLRDPSGRDHNALNSDCLINGGLNCFLGMGWIWVMIKRGEIRERYNIEGSGFGDCCVAYWLPCCATIQQDNEVRIRQSNMLPVTQGYQAQQPMVAPGQPQMKGSQ